MTELTRLHYRSALVDPHYLTCVALMCDASDMLGDPPAVLVGPAGVHWQVIAPSTSLLASPITWLRLPWTSYEHSDVAW